MNKHPIIKDLELNSPQSIYIFFTHNDQSIYIIPLLFSTPTTPTPTHKRLERAITHSPFTHPGTQAVLQLAGLVLNQNTALTACLAVPVL